MWVDVENRTVINDQGRCIASFQPSEFEKYSQFYNPDVYMTTARVDNFVNTKDCIQILSDWWIEGKKFQARVNGIYPTIHLITPYIYMQWQ